MDFLAERDQANLMDFYLAVDGYRANVRRRRHVLEESKGKGDADENLAALVRAAAERICFQVRRARASPSHVGLNHTNNSNNATPRHTHVRAR